MNRTDRVLVALGRLGWRDDEPSPSLAQVFFTLVLLADLLMRDLGGAPAAELHWPRVAVAVSALIGVLVLVRPRRLPTVHVLCSVAILQLAILGVADLGAHDGGAGLLVVVPALWLGGHWRFRGALLSVALTLILVTMPALIVLGPHGEVPSRIVMLTVVAGVSAVGIAAGLHAAQTAKERAECRESELAAALQVIEQQRRSAQAIFDAVDIGLMLIGPDGRPTLMNQGMRRNTAMAYPDGVRDDRHVVAADGDSVLPLADTPSIRASRGEEFDDVRVWIGDNVATRRAVSVSARRVVDDDGTVVGAALAYKDVTDYMRALQVKDEFVALVSHELRTPLTSIVGYVSIILERQGLDPVLRRHLEIVARNADRLQRLVADLLEEAQQDRGPVQLDAVGTDLATIVRHGVQAARPSAEAAGVVLRMEVPDALELVGDPQRLGQVLDNLLSNAIKHTESGGLVAVRVDVLHGLAALRVIDTGIGISREDCTRIFGRFFRTRDASDRAIPGVGLGLSITKSIVESHGGFIEVDSERGRGSEFRVLLPLPAASLAS